MEVFGAVSVNTFPFKYSSEIFTHLANVYLSFITQLSCFSLATRCLHGMMDPKKLSFCVQMFFEKCGDIIGKCLIV